MSRAEPPTDDLAGFEVEDDCKVVFFTTEAEVSEILHPGAGICHVLVALPGSRPCFVTKYREALQSIRHGRYLCWRRATAPFLAERRHDDASERSDAAGFLLTPAKMECQPTDAVEWMFGMCYEQRSNSLNILDSLLTRSSVVACPADT